MAQSTPIPYLSLFPEIRARSFAPVGHRGQEPVFHPRQCRGSARAQSPRRGHSYAPAFARDIEKVLNIPAYNRYTDKTQVFSFVQNADISRRALHVQLVSRISRNIGRLLGLNCDLIEAIALGHDLGHTPFGHAGERFLSACYNRRTGRYFNHNVQSVRVLDQLYRRNISPADPRRRAVPQW